MSGSYERSASVRSRAAAVDFSLTKGEAHAQEPVQPSSSASRSSTAASSSRLSSPPATRSLAYLTLDEALPRGLAITETDTAGAVPELAVDNPLDHKVLLYDGEELVGAKQKAAANQRN